MNAGSLPPAPAPRKKIPSTRLVKNDTHGPALRSRILAGMLLISTSPLGAQQSPTAGSLAGTVERPDGTPIAGASVSVTERERNLARSSSTDAQGRFTFPLLAVGDYELAASADGFAPAQQRLRLAVGAALDVPIVLAPAHAESITVTTEERALLDVARTQVSAMVTPEEVRDLPLNGRNYLDLALLAPGVSRTNTGANQRFAETSAVPGTGISISTQRNIANSFVVDGLSANDDAAELAGTFFSQEVIRELAVVRAGGVAELGRSSAGVINVVTRSGGNAFHGGAYGFFRDDRLDGDNALSGQKLPLEQRQYGATAGGALVRDRTFYFANLEQMRQRAGLLVTIAPSSVEAINVRLDAAGHRGPRIATGPVDATLDTTNAFARVDHQPSLDHQLALRINSYDVASDNARTVGGLNAESRGTSLDNHDRTLAAHDVWLASTRALAETRAQGTRSRLAAPPNDTTGPAVTISGVANLGTATNSPTRRDIDLYELVETGTWLAGRHSVKGGVDLLRNRVTIGFPGALQGVYSFRNLADFQAGRYSSYQQAFGSEQTTQTNDNLSLFVQDEWRAAPRLTVNAGLRYDLQKLPSLVDDDRDNISPRLGAAWDARGDGRSVVRVVAGLYYGPIPLRAVANALQRDGVRYRIAQVGPTAAGAPTFPETFPEFPAGVLTNVTTIDPGIETSSSLQAGLQVEQAIGRLHVAALGYEHLRGRHIIMSRNVNVPTTTDPAVPNLGRPDPRFANNGQFQAVGDSWYDGLTVALSRRPAGWGSYRLSYTYSKGLDTSGNFFFSQPQDAADVAAERGRSDNDQRHRLAVSGTLTSPPLAGGSARARGLLQGWLVSYVFTYASALPFNVVLPNDRNGDTNFNDRPPGVGRNAGRGFDYRSLDLRLAKTFTLREEVTVEGIVDVFNALDRANYQVPNNVLGSPTFGRPTAINDPRQVQLGVRLAF